MPESLLAPFSEMGIIDLILSIILSSVLVWRIDKPCPGLIGKIFIGSDSYIPVTNLVKVSSYSPLISIPGIEIPLNEDSIIVMKSSARRGLLGLRASIIYTKSDQELRSPVELEVWEIISSFEIREREDILRACTLEILPDFDDHRILIDEQDLPIEESETIPGGSREGLDNSIELRSGIQIDELPLRTVVRPH